MTKRGGVGTFVLIILVLISLAVGGGGVYLFQKEHAKSIELEEKLDDITAKQKASEMNLANYKRKSADFENKLKLAEENIGKLSNLLDEEKSARLKALAKLDQLSLDLQEQKSLRSDLENKLNKSEEDSRKTQEQMVELGSRKSELEAKIRGLEAKTKGIELGNITVQPAADNNQRSVSAGGLEGSVSVVNRDYNFAVINLGAKDGLKSGELFSVYNGNKYIGDLKVEKVHDAMSAAGFTSGGIREKISEGDKVVQKTK